MRMLVILMSVVTFTVSAQAHCAWVLWSGTLTEPMNWYPSTRSPAATNARVDLKWFADMSRGSTSVSPTPLTRVGRGRADGGLSNGPNRSRMSGVLPHGRTEVQTSSRNVVEIVYLAYRDRHEALEIRPLRVMR
jgi:hypothetical protein